MRLRNVLPIAVIVVAVVIILSLKSCNSGEAGAPTDVPGPAETAIPETANHTGEDPTNYESSEAGNSPVSESTHESTEATEATEPTSTEAKPSESKPTNPAPTEPKPTEPKPTEPKPTEPKPTEPKPTEPKPTEPKPTEPKPTEPKPTEPKPTEPKPTEPAPTEPKPTEPVHTHSWSGWNQSKAPTCTASGEEVRTCSCGAKESRTVNALGHSWSGWSQTKAPTCGAEGAETRSCSRCGVSESRSVPATGNHSWNETAPTCTEAGSKTCKVCGKQEAGAAALGHDWVHHDEEGHWIDVLTCRCGQVFYSYEDWHAHMDSYYDTEEEGNHSGYWGTGEWIVDKPAYDVCSRCGMTR